MMMIRDLPGPIALVILDVGYMSPCVRARMYQRAIACAVARV